MCGSWVACPAPTWNMSPSLMPKKGDMGSLRLLLNLYSYGGIGRRRRLVIRCPKVLALMIELTWPSDVTRVQVFLKCPYFSLERGIHTCPERILNKWLGNCFWQQQKETHTRNRQWKSLNKRIAYKSHTFQGYYRASAVTTPLPYGGQVNIKVLPSLAGTMLW